VWLEGIAAMETVYLWAAVIAGTVLLAQTVLNLAGLTHMSADIDIHPDGLDLHSTDSVDGHSGFWLAGMLTVKAILGGITVFGLTGLATIQKMSLPLSALLAVSAGGATMYAVGWLINWMHGLNSDGTVDIRNAVGMTGSVYLTIPAQHAGVGKITLSIQGRQMEYEARTSGEKLPTGTIVEVVSLLGDDIVEVCPSTATENS